MTKLQVATINDCFFVDESMSERIGLHTGWWFAVDLLAAADDIHVGREVSLVMPHGEQNSTTIAGLYKNNLGNFAVQFSLPLAPALQWKSRDAYMCAAIPKDTRILRSVRTG